MSKRKHKKPKIEIDAPTPPLGIEIERTGTTTVMYVVVSNEVIAVTKVIEDDVVADYDATGRLVGFEVIGVRPGKLGQILARIRERFAGEVPSLNLLNELLPA